MRRLIGMFAGILLACLAAPAPGDPLYTVMFENNSVSSASPLARDTSFALYTSNGSGTFSGAGTTGPGFVNLYESIATVWGGDFSGGNIAQARASAQASDFMISGPGGSVTGTLHLRVVADFQHLGGFAGNGAHGSNFAVRAGIIGYGNIYMNSYSSLQVTNFGSSGTGALAGQTGPHVDVSFDETASFPANAPLNLILTLESGANSYGNASTNDGFVEMDAGGDLPGGNGRGLRLDGSSGVIMTVPAGYTVSAPSWGIINGTLAVDPARSGGAMRLWLESANPSRGEMRFALTLPGDGPARVTVYDVAGRARRTLLDDWQSAGTRTITWDGQSDDGATAPAGLYFVRAESRGELLTQRVVRVR